MSETATTLSVSQIVEAATPGIPARPGAGCWSTALTGSIFHQVAAELLRSWSSVLDADTVGDSSLLSRHAYSTLLGPRLVEHQAALQGHSGAVLALWTATQELCRLLCELLNEARNRGMIRFSPDELRWQGAESLFETEVALSYELRAGGRIVQVRGIADAVWRNPTDGAWCVLELKTSRRAPEAELAQACLYHRMITGSRSENGSVAIVRFTPNMEFVTFRAEQLREVQQKLDGLILRLGGGAGEAAPPAASEHAELARRVVTTLRHYGFDISQAGEPIAGPSYIRVRLSPGRGVRIKSVQDQATNVQVQLRLSAPPIIQVDNGELVVDVQRQDRRIVSFASVQQSLPQPDRLTGNSKAMLGVELTGQVRYVDLQDDNTSHILVAGTPGSGKSEWMRVAIASLILTNTPETLRLVLIDPKHTAFNDLRHSPFLWRPDSLALPPDGNVEEALDDLIEEMERRYKLMEQHGADKLAELIRKTGRPIPRIVCVCDEFADLLQSDRRQGKAIEQRIVRLGSKARAAAIHLILATQHPNRDVISGALKTTLGGRICLRTTSHVQSQLMSTPNAEKLLGKGDLLFLETGQPVRLQSPYLAPEERRRIFLSNNW